VPRGTSFLTSLVGGVPVVSAPCDVDITNAGALRAALLAAAEGHRTVVADLSAAGFCDSRAVRELVGVSRQLAGEGGELRLVVTAGSVLRALVLLGASQILPVFQTVTDAVAVRTTIP
jgi:anti-sigma B factor antagonist